MEHVADMDWPPDIAQQVTIAYGDLPNQNLSPDLASDVLKTWRAKNPAQFGRVLAEVYVRFALRGTEGE